MPLTDTADATGAAPVGELANCNTFIARVVPPPKPPTPPTSPTPPKPPTDGGAGETPKPPVDGGAGETPKPPVDGGAGETPKPPVSGGPGTGLIVLQEYVPTLAASGQAARRQALLAADLTINGAHSSPMRNLVEPGQNNLWLAGDLGRQEQGRELGVGELGIALGLADGVQAMLSVGTTRSNMDLELDGFSKQNGFYVVPELMLRLPQSLYLTLSGYYGQGESELRRGYLNAGNPDYSKGSTDFRTFGVRARIDMLNAFSLGNTQLTPSVSYTYNRTQHDAYSETSGSFPVAWGEIKESEQIVRLGMDASHRLERGITLLGRIEHAERAEGQGKNIKGEIIGVQTFELPGASYDRRWERGLIGLEGPIGGGVVSLTLNQTTQDDSLTWINASWRKSF